MTDALTRGPSWIAGEPRRYVGENPLAVSRHVTAQSRKLATVAISTTFHARYYTLHALVAEECASRELSRDEQVQLMRRCEVVLAAITLQHGGEHSYPLNPHGIRAISAALDRDGRLNLAALAAIGDGSYTRAQWGFFWDYATVEQALGLVRWTREGLKPGPHLDAEKVKAGLGGILKLARQDVLELEELRAHAEFCLCRMPSSTDGDALRERLLPTDSDPHAKGGGSSQTIRLLLALLELNGGGSGNLQEELGDVLLFDSAAQQDARLEGLEVTAAWKGLLLREKSVRAWHRLWKWTVAQIDGITTVEELGRAVASELPDETVGTYVSKLPRRSADAAADGVLLPAEVQVDHDETRTYVDRQLAKLLLGALRLDELSSRVAIYFEHPPTERQTRLRPGWLRDLLPQWVDEPLRDFAIYLTHQMTSRASQISLSKARFDSSTCLYELPLGVSLHDGLVVKDADQLSIDTWFRWNAIARILVGVGLTELVDGRWQVAERGRQRWS